MTARTWILFWRGTQALFVALILCSGTAVAQSAASSGTPEAPLKPVLPSGPLLQSVAAFAEWTITFSYPEERQKPAPGEPAPAAAYLNKRIRTIDTTKTQEIVREVITSVDGSKISEWTLGNTQFRKSADSPLWLQGQLDSTTGSAAPGGTLPASGFRDMDWISKDAYMGTIKYGDKNCLVFSPGAPLNLELLKGAEQMKKLDELGRVALIDATTRFPVEVRMDGVIRYYQFGDAPDMRLTLPPDLLAQIKNGNEARARLLQPAPRPY